MERKFPNTVLCKSNESKIRRNLSFVLTNIQGNFEQYFANLSSKIQRTCEEMLRGNSKIRKS